MKKNNKGFSLVELIIVIAIMAILVGVMAPQLIKYIEKSKESSDKQLCDTIRSAVTTALLDPDVNDDSDYTLDTDDWKTAQDLSTVMSEAVIGEEIIDIVGADASDCEDKLKSKKAKGKTIYVQVGGKGEYANQVYVYVDDPDGDIHAGQPIAD